MKHFLSAPPINLPPYLVRAQVLKSLNALEKCKVPHEPMKDAKKMRSGGSISVSSRACKHLYVFFPMLKAHALSVS